MSHLLVDKELFSKPVDSPEVILAAALTSTTLKELDTQGKSQLVPIFI